MDFASWLAAIALTVAAIVAIAQYRLNRRLTKIEERREDDRRAATASANLGASFFSAGDSGRYDLQIFNRGPAAARNVRVAIDGTPAEEHPQVFDHPEPGFRLAPGTRASYRISLTMQSDRPPWTVRMEWDDDSGQDRWEKTTVTV